MADEDTVQGSVFLLEKELGLNKLDHLRSEDDWSFVIKSHAFLEAALSYLVCNAIGREELEELVSGLNVGGRFGKLELAKAMGLLEQRDIAFIKRLSSLRNKLVHGVQMVNFDLQICWKEG